MNFDERMEELGIQSGLTVIKDAPHPFLGKQVWFDEMIEVADEFFSKHLRDQSLRDRSVGKRNICGANGDCSSRRAQKSTGGESSNCASK